MSVSRKRPILVTGSPRSGSTWVGRTLEHDSSIAYLHEPFNPISRDHACPFDLDGFYRYICASNEAQYRPCLDRTLQLRAGWKCLVNDSGWRARARAVRRIGRERRARAAGRRVLMKDPIALFSSPWLADTYEFQVVVLIRHPCAFASSLKRLKWWVDFDGILDQHELVRDWIDEPDVYRVPIESGDYVRNAALAWNLFNNVILRFQRAYPDWVFLRHEDLSREPVAEFQNLFRELDLQWSPEVEASIRERTQAGNPVGPGEQVHQLRRDSRQNILRWASALTQAEIDTVHAITRESAAAFYGPEDWAESTLAGDSES